MNWLLGDGLLIFSCYSSGKSFSKQTLRGGTFLSSVLFVYIMAENVAGFLAQGRLISGVHVPGFTIVVDPYMALIIILMAHRK
jgi:hypothetical protein